MSDSDVLVAPTPAWILTPNKRFKVAVGESFMAEYVRDSQPQKIPGAPDYCNQLIMWRDNFIPVIDLNIILGEAPLSASNIAVLSYQEYAGQAPLYVGLKLVGEVERVSVSDDTACEWPEDYPLEIQPIIESLFIHEEQLISIMNVADLCNEGYRDFLTQLFDIKAAL